MSSKLKWTGIVAVFLFGVYIAGPSPSSPDFVKSLPVVPENARSLEAFVARREAAHMVKPDNEARIVWADSMKKKTPYSIVYLHGYGSSQGEGDPVHRDFAKEFGCNLYLSRLSDHGIDTTENMLGLTVDRLWQSAEEALAIGKAIGDHVIIMSTSTGGTLALVLAAEYPDDVYALLNMSPNIRVKHPLGFIANNHWGLQIGRMVMHGKYLVSTPVPGQDQALKNQYWYTTYRLEAVSQLQEMLEDKMTKATFEKVKQPCLSLYYYKDDAHQDNTVNVQAIIKMNDELGTQSSMKAAIAIPEAGDHVIGSSITSHDLPAVKMELEKFAIGKLGLQRNLPK